MTPDPDWRPQGLSSGQMVQELLKLGASAEMIAVAVRGVDYAQRNPVRRTRRPRQRRDAA